MDRWLLVGLGNPEPRYQNNRHNVGFMVVDALGEVAGCEVNRSKFKGLYGTGRLGDTPVALLKPQTFMNLSGRSVAPAKGFFDVDLERVLVIHDEIDLPFGALRLKIGGGHAGHNGLRSMVTELGGNGFVRLRVGVGRPKHGDVSNYVLSDFDAEQREWLPELLERAVAAVRATLSEGPRKAMNLINAKPRPEEA